MPKRKGSARTEQASAAKRKGAVEPVAPAPEPRRLNDVPNTKEKLDVAGFGEVEPFTTYLTGALIGKAVTINNSAWPGYSSGTTRCAPTTRSCRLHTTRRCAAAASCRLLNNSAWPGYSSGTTSCRLHTTRRRAAAASCRLHTMHRTARRGWGLRSPPRGHKLDLSALRRHLNLF